MGTYRLLVDPADATYAPPPGQAEIVEALRLGDERVFAALVDEYGPAMLRVARMYVSSRAVAEEVVQEAWLGVIGGIGRFEEHVAVCAGCSAYLDQIRTTIALAGRVTADDLMEETKTELLAAFRDWKRE